MSPDNEHKVVADDRENAGGVIAELRRFPGIDLRVERLYCGDFDVEDRILVERKTLKDLATSIVDGRLFRQISSMAQRERRSVLISEGNSAEFAQLGVSRESMQGALITVTVFYGIAVLRSLDAAETARLVLHLAQQTRRAAHGCFPRGGYRPTGLRRRQLFILQGLPGIGPHRAEKLLGRFHSIRSVVNADLNELSEVDGIGPRTAAEIRRCVGAETSAP